MADLFPPVVSPCSFNTSFNLLFSQVDKTILVGGGGGGGGAGAAGAGAVGGGGGGDAAAAPAAAKMLHV